MNFKDFADIFGDSDVGNLKLEKIFVCWWDLLNVGARNLC